MKFFRFFISILLSVALVYSLNQKIGDIPPLGKLLDPFHGFWQNANNEPLNIRYDISLPQLRDEVKIQYESNLIPHIFAKNDYDLYFTQGYITAYHRLWQMEFITFVASGRISEVFGDRALNFDRIQRRKGLNDGTEKALKSLQDHPEVYESVQAYSDGVNAYIEQLEYKDLSLEYKLFNYWPEAWDPFKSLLTQKYLADDLNSDRDLQNTNLVKLFGKERFDFLFPDFPEEIDPIIPVGTPWEFDPVETFSPDKEEIMEAFSVNVQENFKEGIGSNNWAVSGSRTESGHAILCNDPHLGLNLPLIWYAQQLNSPGINTYGVTVPGVPGILLGFNDSIAWGATNADRDLRDWYQISFRDDQCDEYLYGGKWLKTQKRIETIKVKGQDDYLDTVVYTHYGPVVYDKKYMGDSNRVNFALKWTAHNASVDYKAFYDLCRAQNITAALAATNSLDCPPQNFALASRSGDIAQVVQGNYPLKWEEQGKFIMDGSDPNYEWQGYIPKDHNARIINPERGFISSANQHPFDSDYPYYYHSRSEEKFRNKRINSVLNASEGITIDDMKILQNDNYYSLAASILPVMIDSLRKKGLSDEQKQVLGLLQDWDYMANADQVEPSYFRAWYKKMYDLLWDEFDIDVPVAWPSDYTTMTILTKWPLDTAFDLLKTPEVENINDIITESYVQGLDSIYTWKELNNGEDPLWYKFKNTQLAHMTGIESFSYTQVPVGGYVGIVNATSGNWGASWRMIVELGDEIEAWGVYPGGQSGNPGSTGYDTFIEDWARGEYFKISFWGNYDEAREGVKNITLTKEAKVEN
jgi:penicillin amidase